jgi:hypothetical protein
MRENMKTETKKKAVYKNVVSHYEEDIIYVTADGQKFNNEKDAINHERQIEYLKKWDAVKKKNSGLEVSSDIDDAFYASNEEELDIIKEEIGVGNGYDYVYVNNLLKNEKELRVGEWIFHHYLDGGDYRGAHNIFTFSFLKEQFESFINRFSE